MSLNREPRLWGASVIAGGVLFVAAACVWPPLTDPWNPDYALREVGRSPHWATGHAVMTAGITLWLLGMGGCACLYTQRFHLPRMSVSLFISALVKWLLIMSMEMALLPHLAADVVSSGNMALGDMFKLTLSAALIALHFAVAFGWLAVTLLGIYLREEGHIRPGFGIAAGIIGLAGVGASLAFHQGGKVILPATSAVPFLWTLRFAQLRFTEEGRRGTVLT